MEYVDSVHLTCTSGKRRLKFFFGVKERGCRQHVGKKCSKTRRYKIRDIRRVGITRTFLHANKIYMELSEDEKIIGPLISTEVRTCGDLIFLFPSN